jgi:hypothetical protein
VRGLNPLVAVKIRSAAVHAALATVPDTELAIFVDENTRIQVIETMSDLPTAEKDQKAAFIVGPPFSFMSLCLSVVAR